MLMDPRIESLARRGRRLRREGLCRKAANAYGELTSIEPEYSPWWVLLGVCHRDMNRTDEARKCLRQALYLLRRQASHTGLTARIATVLCLLEGLDQSAAAKPQQLPRN